MKLIRDFSEVAGYKVNIQKSTVFLYTSNEFEIKNTMPCTLTPKEILRYKFNKICSRSIYKENYKTLMKEMKDLNKWKDSSHSWTGRPNIVKKTQDVSSSQLNL